MLLSLRSPKGGAPIRDYIPTQKGVPNFKIGDISPPVVTQESFYCHRLGWILDGEKEGEPVYVKDGEGYKLYILLDKIYGGEERRALMRLFHAILWFFRRKLRGILTA